VQLLVCGKFQKHNNFFLPLFDENHIPKSKNGSRNRGSSRTGICDESSIFTSTRTGVQVQVLVV